ncbi:hypothetical protein RGQ13_13815 [Thalassotalea psychrophila]|uniref:Uncharacterized protein n=1 Tax=Thalassotalea psychrophila TaxID=3065647 RepID=A0ABY9TQV6_9GAMM|nr:hypothetical protein RGQ13_13815 [Colwelliaceae bacterium SQ149]
MASLFKATCIASFTDNVLAAHILPVCSVEINSGIPPRVTTTQGVPQASASTIVFG